jgi:hypothetical protein
MGEKPIRFRGAGPFHRFHAEPCSSKRIAHPRVHLTKDGIHVSPASVFHWDFKYEGLGRHRVGRDRLRDRRRCRSTASDGIDRAGVARGADHPSRSAPVADGGNPGGRRAARVGRFAAALRGAQPGVHHPGYRRGLGNAERRPPAVAPAGGFAGGRLAQSGIRPLPHARRRAVVRLHFGRSGSGSPVYRGGQQTARATVDTDSPSRRNHRGDHPAERSRESADGDRDRRDQPGLPAFRRFGRRSHHPKRIVQHRRGLSRRRRLA